MRPIRWPAEHLDTLGGYLTYHNIQILAYFLAVYGVVQGARAIRGAEERHSLEVILATGWSRTSVLRDRALGFLASLAVITFGIALGVAWSMAAGGEPNLAGSFVTITATGLVALVAYALGPAPLPADPYRPCGGRDRRPGDHGALRGHQRVGGPRTARHRPVHLALPLRQQLPRAGARARTGHLLDGCPRGPSHSALARTRRPGLPAPGLRTRRSGRGRPPGRRSRRATSGSSAGGGASVWRVTLFRGRVGLLAWTVATAAFAGMYMSLAADRHGRLGDVRLHGTHDRRRTRHLA